MQYCGTGLPGGLLPTGLEDPSGHRDRVEYIVVMKVNLKRGEIIMEEFFEEKVEVNKTQHEEHKIQCSKCHNDTLHEVVFSVDITGENGYDAITYWESYQIVQCKGCKTISFRKNSKNTEDKEYYEDEEYLVDHEDIYPGRISGRGKIKNYWRLPSVVRQVYEETITALSYKLTILGGIGIRTLLDTICREKQAKGKDLKEKINDLVNIGVLTNDGATILHSLRDMGNNAAHEAKPPDSYTLDISIDIVESLLQNVYIFPKLVADK